MESVFDADVMDGGVCWLRRATQQKEPPAWVARLVLSCVCQIGLHRVIAFAMRRTAG
jgi:hypothetical protein